MNVLKSILHYAIVLLTMACSSQNENLQQQELNVEIAKSIGYNFHKIDEKHNLIHDLDEISGISYFAPNKIACVQDEEGRIFIYDYNQRKITSKIRFAQSGDYEGITSLANNFYVVRSDGDIFQYNARAIETKHIRTPLSSDNNVEGLCVDIQTNSLLIVCKGSPSLKGTKVKGRAVYSYSLRDSSLSKDPAFTITRKMISESFMSKSSSDFDFRPSGIAIHPITKNIFVVASVGKVLVVMNPKGQIVAAISLNAKIFQQPEGITFAPNGDMFISNEGKNGKPNILRFNYHPIESNE